MIPFLTSILSAPFCICMIMKQFAWNLHLFKFWKLPCWKRIAALLNITLINHSYRVDITFLLNSQWAGKLALPAITILISLANVFIYKVPLPYLEPFILFWLTKERAYLWELVINHINNTMWPHRQATASRWSSSLIINTHLYLLSCGALWASSVNFKHVKRWFPSWRACSGMVIGEIKTVKWSGGLKIKKTQPFVDLFSCNFHIGCLQ